MEKRIRSSFLFIALYGVFVGSHPGFSADDYLNFSELSTARSEGLDFRVTVVQPKKDGVSVIAPHGGTIESGTEVLARDLEKQGFGLYLFESLICRRPTPHSEGAGECLPGRYGNLHLTSHRFDDPRALSLVAASHFCLSLHGYGSKTNEEAVMIGGLAEAGVKRFTEVFRSQFPGITLVSAKNGLAGKHPENIVNRCQKQGVQIEMSPALRKKIKQDSDFRKKLSTALGDTLKAMERSLKN